MMYPWIHWVFGIVTGWCLHIWWLTYREWRKRAKFRRWDQKVKLR